MNRYHTPLHARQNGAVMVVSLMMLVVMTLIGVTAMRTTVLEEKMSGNTRDTMLAFEAAETALLDGEDYLANTINALAVAFDGAQLGLYQAGSRPDLFADATWLNSIAHRGTYPGVTSQPRFIIEYAGQLSDSGGNDITIADYGELSTLGTPYTFRVTARGTGGTDNAVVLLQSNYVRTF